MKVLASESGAVLGDAVIDELRAQVEALDTSDDVHCVNSVVDVLGQLGGIREFSAARFHLLEACHVSLCTLADGMVRPEPAARMPLDVATFAGVSRILEALEMLGAEYEVVAGVLDRAASQPGEDGHYQEAYCLYRQLELLDISLIICARVYLPAPALLWTGTHAIVDRAIGLGALDFAPAQALDAPGIGDLYARMLLTALADPYRLTSRQLAAVRSVVRETAGGADFRTPAHYANADSERRYLFAIDFDLDVAALPWRASAIPGSSEFELVVDVSRLVRLARKRQLAIRNDPETADPLLEPAAGLGLNRRSAEALYKHLVVEWGKQPIRKSQRRAEQRSYDCLIGFDAMQQAHRIDFSSPDEGSTEIVLSGGVGDMFDAVEPAGLAPEDAGVVRAMSADISATGIRLVISTSANPALRIGELIGWRDASTNDPVWITGLIRWMRSASSDAIEAGVLVLGRFHDRAALHFIDNGEASRSSMPAVLIKDSPYRGSREWLLTSQEVASGDDAVRLVTSDGTRELDALTTALQTRHVVCHSSTVQESKVLEPA